MSLTALLITLLVAVGGVSGHASTPPDIAGLAKVHDGDTIRVMMDGKSQSVRIWGIDAVELKQTCVQDDRVLPCGTMARDALKEIIGDDPVQCIAKGKSYQRVVALCTVNGRDVAKEMARTGMAFEAVKYSKGFYSREENAARANHAGLWAMNAQAPDHWRACQRKTKRPADC